MRCSLEIEKAASGIRFLRILYISLGAIGITIEMGERGGHDVPKEEVLSGLERSMGFLPDYIAVSDHAEAWDNSSESLVSVSIKEEGKVRFT